MKKILILTIIGGFVFNTSFAQTKKLFKYPFVKHELLLSKLFELLASTYYKWIYHPKYSQPKLTNIQWT
jgi:hypothetical protein